MRDGIGDFAFWLAMGFTSLGLLFGPIGRALGGWIDSYRKPTPGLEPDVHGRLAAFEGLAERLHEMEERLDFAEQLLAQQREAPRIGQQES
jgi:hypothetical protein